MSVLDDIRRAAFELRQSDPQEAVRVLRKAAQAGGEAEVLARGALGEIYLEEFGDLDGAASEFKKVLEAAPGLIAAEIGLARTRREAGDLARADAGFERAIAGLQRDVRTFREAKELPPGAEEIVLTLLEVAVELAELRSGAVRLDEELLSWAADEKLFDSEEPEEAEDAALPATGTEEHDDWVRFHSLWTQLRLRTGRAEEALTAIRLAERQGELPAAEGARLLSLALEDLGEKARAGAEARRRLSLLEKPWPVGEVVRAAHLLGADEVLREAIAQHDPQSEEAAALREALGVKPLVSLNRKN
jgi:tetratricopeptide (TPR) repeat protein